jgi:hypothetical protein
LPSSSVIGSFAANSCASRPKLEVVIEMLWQAPAFRIVP